MSQRMSNPPICFAIGQVRHNAVTALGDKYLSVLQETFRSKYPDYRPVQTQKLIAVMPAAEGASASPQFSVSAGTQYRFQNVEGTQCVILSDNSISLQTTDYDTHEPFISELISVVQMVSEAVGGLAIVERLGLRYVDAVTPSVDEDIRLYLVPEVQAIGPRLDQEFLIGHNYSETLVRTPDRVQILTRTVCQKARLTLPQDLGSPSMQLPSKFSEYVSNEHIHALIDTDGFMEFSETREPFKLETVEKHFLRIYTVIKDVFRKTVTPHALKIWGDTA
jgi:uncharacterized protein (TIGR04255 family)